MIDAEIDKLCSQLTKIIMAEDGANEETIFAELKKEANGYINYCVNAKRDPEIVIRALKYLSYTHAFTKTRAKVDTYCSMLEVLMELAVPLVLHSTETIGFFNDLEDGIDVARHQSNKSP